MLTKDELQKKLIAELKKKQAPQNNNFEPLPLEDSLALDLPPSYLPPTLTDGTMLDEEGKKLLRTLENKYKEFFQVGENLSEKADILPDVIDGILGNLDLNIVNRMPDGGFAFTLFMHNIMASAQYLSKLSDPVPTVSAKIQNLSSMYLLDIKHTFFELRNGIVDSNYNEAFKTRAIQCVLLTMALGKLQKSKDILNNVDNEIFSYLVNLMISPLQRLAQLGLFANDAIEIFKALQSCSNLTQLDKEIIAETLIILEELFARSKLIGIVANTIKVAVDLVAMDTLEMRFSDAALKQLEFFKTLVPTFVTLTMEAEFTKELSINVTEKLNLELASHLTLQSAGLYRKLCRLIDTSKVDAQPIESLKAAFKKDLCVIHENTSFDDESKCKLMNECINNNHKKLQATGGSFFFARQQSDFEIKLVSFIDKETNANSNVPKLG